jgi:ubiquinone/menaquinone biosynthesis C-methylase UbiE
MPTPRAIPYYDAIAGDYDRADGDLSRRLGERYLEFLVNIKIPGGKMLDVGIGTGLMTQAFRKRGRAIHGVDGSPNMIEAAVGNGFKRENLHVVDLETAPLPFDDDSFSITITNSSLVYIHNAAQVVAEMIRVTKPGGIIVIDPLVHLNDFADTVSFVTRDGIPPNHAQSDNELHRIFAAHGVEILKEMSFGGRDFDHPQHGPVKTEDVVYILRKRPAPA